MTMYTPWVILALAVVAARWYERRQINRVLRDPKVQRMLIDTAKRHRDTEK